MPVRTTRDQTIQMTILLCAAMMAGPESSGWLRSAQGQVATAAQGDDKTQRSDSDGQTKDRLAIEATMASFAKAFQAGDAKSLAAHWTAGGEYQNESGIYLQGREALETRFAEFFATAPDPSAETQRKSMRFLSSDLAIIEGSVSVRRGPAEPAKSAKFSVLLARDGGQWRIAQMRESPDDQVTIEELGWLIGDWKSVSKDGAEIETSYAWDANKKFIHVRFTIKETAIGLEGTQIIGVDPETGGIRSWTFEASGGVGEANWERDGDHWVLDLVGTAADGRTLTETNVLRQINADTITWQSVNRMLDDVEIPDLAPVKLTRVK